jgi:hypothetical protein
MPTKSHMTGDLRGDRGPDHRRVARRSAWCCPAWCRRQDRHTAHAARLGLAGRVRVPPPRIDGACDERPRKLDGLPGLRTAVADGTSARVAAGKASWLSVIVAWPGHRELADLAASAAASGIAGGGW